MLRSAPVCPTCYTDYDSKQHLPKIIIDCGHTICLKCLKTILQDASQAKCPLDDRPLNEHKRSLKSFPTNYTVVQLVEESPREEICKEHGEKRRLICHTDKTKICDDCAHFGQHKGHNFQPIKEIKGQLNKKREQLETTLDILDNHCTEIYNITDQTWNSLEEMIKYRFTELKKQVKKKELELLWETKSFFDHLKQQIANNFGRNSTLAQGITNKVYEYKRLFQNEEIYNLIEEDPNLMTSNISAEKLDKAVEEFEEGLETMMSNFDQSFSSFNYSVAGLNLLVKDLVKVCSESFKSEHYQSLSLNFEENFQLVCETKLKSIVKEDTLVISLRAQELEVAMAVDKIKDIGKVIMSPGELKLSDKDATAFLYIWRHVKKPASFEIICSDTEMTDSVLSSTLSGISFISSDICSFTLRVESCHQITDESIFLLVSKIIPNMKNLEHLKLYLSGTCITDDSIVMFAQRSAEIVKSLLSLEIDLRGTQVIGTFGDELLDKLLPQIEFLESLKILIDDMGMNDKIYSQIEVAQAQISNRRSVKQE